jgi:hypothetical protein
MELKIRGVAVEGIDNVVITAYAVPALGWSKRGEAACGQTEPFPTSDSSSLAMVLQSATEASYVEQCVVDARDVDSCHLERHDDIMATSLQVPVQVVVSSTDGNIMASTTSTASRPKTWISLPTQPHKP